MWKAVGCLSNFKIPADNPPLLRLVFWQTWCLLIDTLQGLFSIRKLDATVHLLIQSVGIQKITQKKQKKICQGLPKFFF